MSGEKTEKATPKRKDDERKKGNVFQSKEILAVASLMIMFNLANMILPMVSGNLYSYIESSFSSIVTGEVIKREDIFSVALEAIVVLGIVAGPMLLASGFVAVVVTMAQTRMLFTFESIKFKFSKLNPISGIKRMFSLRGVIELLKSIVKIVALVVIIYNIIVPNVNMLFKLFDMQPNQAVTVLGNITMQIVNTVGGIFIFLAILDYVYQWWEYEKSLRMSKQEIKEEYKQIEGDPQIKGKIKEKQRAMAQSRMMQAVPSADVVIRNPTHFAVALKYDKETSKAPKVVAKGKDLVALRIVELAEKNGVETVENPPLARGLYAAVEVDMEIPESFYKAVADVLVFVYGKRDKKSSISDELNIR